MASGFPFAEPRCGALTPSPERNMKKKVSTKATGQSKAEKIPAAEAAAEAPAKTRWTFLTNHAHVLALIHRHPDAVLRNIALEVGITERAVQRIVQELEEAGFLERERVGRRNHYQVRQDLPLRHPIEAHRTIGDLLGLVDLPEV